MDKKTKCKSKDYTAQFTINILTHIAFLIFILTMVFSFYTEKIMTNAVNSQINKVINENLDNNLDSSRVNISKYIDILKKEGYDPKKYLEMAKKALSEESSREIHNKLIKNILYIFSFSLLFAVIFSFIITKMLCTKIHLFDILIENYIIFFFVGIIELLFFKFIILKYIPAYPSEVKNKLLEKLKKY
jgi:hypothetical protein